MNNVLSRIERDIIVANLSEDLPLLILKSISTEFIPSEQHIPQFTPITIKPKTYSITAEGIIFMLLIDYNLSIPDKTPVCVFFYYKGRGLFFETEFRCLKQGYALVISPHIYKQLDDSQPFEKQLKAKLFFNTQQKKSLSIDCFPHSTISLFSRDLWKNFSKENENVGVSIINSITTNSFTTIADVFTKKNNEQGNFLSSISAALYLCNEELEIPSVLGRVEPLILLFLSDKEIVLGCQSDQMPIYTESEYALEIFIPIMGITRTIYITMYVNTIVKSPIDNNNKYCALCEITSIREEDSRFLYEKLYGKFLK